MSSGSKWDDVFYVRAYQLAAAGMANTTIARTLGVEAETFNRWLEKRPALEDALSRGRADKGAATFKEFVYKRLPPKLQRLWDEITECEDEPNAIRRIEAMLVDGGKRVRQHLFLYAMIDASFNASEACRRANISKKTLDAWMYNEDGFGELMDEIMWHRKNYCEAALMRLVGAGDSAATVFVNKTLNRDRGYSDKHVVEHQHSGVISHVHTAVPISELQLPFEVRQAILEAIRARKADAAAPETPALAAPAFVPSMLTLDATATEIA